MIDTTSIKVGWFLGIRQLKRSSLWSTVLIIVIMTLTFLNLVVVSGLLVGLIEGAVSAAKDRYTGDLIISTLEEKDFIENSREVVSILESIPGVETVSPRYIASGVLQSNYKERTNFNNDIEEAAAIIAGIDPTKENRVTGIESTLVDGEYLEDGDFDQVVIGALMLSEYLPIDSPGFVVLDGVEIGSEIRLRIGDITREVTVKGIVRSKVDEIDRRLFMVDSQLRAMIDRDDFNVGEISVIINTDEISTERVKEILIANGIDKVAKVQTSIDAQPKFLQDIKRTFSLLGTIISSIGLVVATITVFIVIFINAITRRKYIGIMKGIGISANAIEFSYVVQSLIYAVVGSIAGVLMVYLLLIPYFASHPINFPFSDGILVAPLGITMFRLVLLIITTMLAGYIPARIIVGKNTLDSILGRK